MRAAIFHGEGDVRIEEVPDPEIENSTDAVVRITHTAVCGSDLWFYRGQSEQGERIGHEPMGIVEEVGDEVSSVEPGDRVLAPFAISDGTCEFCRRGLYTSCVDGKSWGADTDGAQAEMVRTPHADGTLVEVPEQADDEGTLRALLPLTDVMGTGHHAAVSAGVEPGVRCAVIGDGAVGLCGVLAAQRLGAEEIIAMGHHEERLELAAEFGATEVVSSRGEEAIAEVTELTNGGPSHVLECVGATGSMNTAIGACRPGGTIGYVGAPYGVDEDFDIMGMFADNVTLRGGVAPVRAYIDELMDDVLGGTLDPSPIFTETVDLDGVPEGYRAMDEREAIKTLVRVEQ